MNAPVGFALGSGTQPEALAPMAALGEELGFSQLWISEDCFYTGGISGAAIALGATRRMPVGLGLVSVCVRHPAVLAMECATLARAFPGRFWPGIGLGLSHGLEQMNLYPRSQLAAVREATVAMRTLLEGGTVDLQGEIADFDGISLAYSMETPPPIYMGGHGPRMMQLSGEVADGTIISIFAGEAYVRWAREHVATGRQLADRTGERSEMPVFAIFCVDHDSQQAKKLLAPIVASFLAVMPRTSLGDVYGITEQLSTLAEGGAAAVLEGMPVEWLDDLCVVGDPDECAAQIRRLLEAGGDSVILFPAPAERSEEMLRMAAEEILPRV
jgi:alkanesulfonate monooxygenase SsuD/methylene tetrahydromethanopterin reductase-like flavin-dependent oxidoreductase (luciferase family)